MLGAPMILAPVNGSPQNCALVKNSDNIVINMIIADPSIDPAPDGCTIVGLPPDSPVTFGWVYNPTTGEFSEQ
jgi:hypothetical protein